MMWSKLSMNLQLGSQELVKYIQLYDLSMYFFILYTYIHVHISAYIRKCQDLVGSESQEERRIISKNIGLKLRDLSSSILSILVTLSKEITFSVLMFSYL